MSPNNKFSWDSKFVKFLELVFDLLIILFCFILAKSINEIFTGHRFLILVDAVRGLADFAEVLTILTVSGIFMFFAAINFYIYKTSVTNKNYSTVMQNVIISLVLASIGQILVSVLLPDFTDFRITNPLLVVQSLFLQIFFLGLYKYFLWRFLRKKNRKQILICGPREEAEKLCKKILLDRSHYKRIKYLCFEIDQKIDDNVFKLIDKVSQVYLTPSLLENNKNKILMFCINKVKIDVVMVPKIYEIGILDSRIESMSDILTFGVKSMKLSVEQRFLKRTFDIIVSLIGLIVSFPIVLVCGMLIKMQDKGEVIYKQERLTRDGRVFRMYKLRSMKMNAEAESGMILSTNNDPRVTSFGKFLRRSRIDEIPQLWNVLKGDMSLVGPRPERPGLMEEIKLTVPDFEYRLNVKPGITGLAQALGTYSTKFDDKLRYDLFYIRKYSFLFDLQIILFTLKSLFNKNSSMGVSVETELKEVLEKFNIKYEESENQLNLLKVPRLSRKKKE
ncbi:MAG: sugar transferase [Erysipelotrichales bacterium]|nr:sugar transferase [Erysipelotrichales bacterium]